MYVRIELGGNKWWNTSDANEWFKSIRHKEMCNFIPIDIEVLYTSVAKTTIDRN